MIRKLDKNRIPWCLVALLPSDAATIGVLNPSVYRKVVDTKIIPGVLSRFDGYYISGVLLFLGLSTLFLFLVASYLRNLRIDGEPA